MFIFLLLSYSAGKRTDNFFFFFACFLTDTQVTSKQVNHFGSLDLFRASLKGVLASQGCNILALTFLLL